MNALYILLLAFLFILGISLTSIISIQKSEIQKLDENVALLERRVRILEDQKEETDTPSADRSKLQE